MEIVGGTFRPCFVFGFSSANTRSLGTPKRYAVTRTGNETRSPLTSVAKIFLTLTMNFALLHRRELMNIPLWLVRSIGHRSLSKYVNIYLLIYIYILLHLSSSQT